MPGHSTDTMMFDFEEVAQAFAWRKTPVTVLRTSSDLPFCSTDEQDALWFQTRNWQSLTWDHWNEHFRGVFFFTAEALAYYMPSILLLSFEQHDERMLAIESLLMRLQDGITCSVGDVELTADILHVTQKECKVLIGWLRYLYSLPDYEAGMNGVRIGRALATLNVGQSPEDLEQGL